MLCIEVLPLAKQLGIVRYVQSQNSEWKWCKWPFVVLSLHPHSQDNITGAHSLEILLIHKRQAGEAYGSKTHKRVIESLSI